MKLHKNPKDIKIIEVNDVKYILQKTQTRAESNKGKREYPKVETEWKNQRGDPSNCAFNVTTTDPNQTKVKTVAKI